jgi:hypothetical protein
MLDPLAIMAIALGGDSEDAVDLAKGARMIPGEVTIRRRRGEYVNYIPGAGQESDMWVDRGGNVIAAVSGPKPDTAVPQLPVEGEQKK